MPLPFVDASFATTGEPIRAARMELHRVSFQHEVAVLRVDSAYASAYPQGSPVRVSWGAFPTTRDAFFGYLHHDKPIADEDQRGRRPETRLICVGATGVLGDHHSRAWLHSRSDLLVEELANSENLLFSAHQGRRTLANPIQAAESSWKFLTRVAREERQVLFGVGPAVLLLDPLVVLSERGPYAMLINRGEALSVRGTIANVDLDDHEAVLREGYAVDENGVLVAAAGRLPGSDRAYRPTPTERRFVTGSWPQSAADLGEEVLVRDRESTLLHDLVVKIPGARAGMVPTTITELRGFGEQYDGFWSVYGAVFRVTPSSEATTELTLRKAPINPRVRAERRGAVLPTTRSDRSMRLVGERWIASGREGAR